jgi:hypothetical protein
MTVASFHHLTEGRTHTDDIGNNVIKDGMKCDTVTIAIL